MKLQAIERETEIDDSKIFGEPFIPEEWLEGNEFSPFEFFVCQINLAQINCPLLPNVGFLYFFVDAPNYNFDKMIAKVRYFEGEPSAYTDFNDGYFDENPMNMALVEKGDGNIDFCEKGDDDKITLLKLSKEYLPDEINGNNLCFEISEDDLKKGDYKKSKIKC